MSGKKSFSPVELKIIDLEGNHLASIRESDQMLSLDIIEHSVDKDLQEIFEQIKTASIQTITGKREERGGKVIHTTRRQEVKPGDPQYLKGLQDWILRKKMKVGGNRVRGLAVGREE